MVSVFLIVLVIVWKLMKSNKEPIAENEIKIENSTSQNENETNFEGINSNEMVKKEITDWRLVLVNHENVLPNDFHIELDKIDKIRSFDARAIGELKQMLENMKQDGITNVWVQSAYRSVERQEKLFQDKIEKYEAQGMSQEEAENLVLRKVNKPGTSEHNLGLAVDFNYVDYGFDETQGFQWLKQNAANYGFILRYEKEKEAITKVDYEPWHWRYVGKENAIKMNELKMCLEEYIEYLKEE